MFKKLMTNILFFKVSTQNYIKTVWFTYFNNISLRLPNKYFFSPIIGFFLFLRVTLKTKIWSNLKLFLKNKIAWFFERDPLKGLIEKIDQIRDKIKSFFGLKKSAIISTTFIEYLLFKVLFTSPILKIVQLLLKHFYKLSIDKSLSWATYFLILIVILCITLIFYYKILPLIFSLLLEITRVWTKIHEPAECMGNTCSEQTTKSSSPGSSTDDAVQINRLGAKIYSNSYQDTTPNPINALRLDRDVSTLVAATTLGATSSKIPKSPINPIQGAVGGIRSGLTKITNDRIQDTYKDEIEGFNKDEETKVDK